MNLYKLRHLSVSSIALTAFLLSCPTLQATDNLEEVNDGNVTKTHQIQIIPKKSQELALSNIESKIGGILVKFEDIDRNVEDSLQKQTFLLGQTFVEKVQSEEDKKKHLIDETESGIGQKVSSLTLIKGKIRAQTSGTSREIGNISVFLDDKTGIAISSALKSRLGKEVSKGIGGFTNLLGMPSDYHNESRYNGYCLIKISDFKSVCDDIDQRVLDIRSIYQILDTILSEATTAVSKAENAQQLIYTNSDSVYNILKEYGGDWYVKLKDKANSADNYIREVKTAAGNVRSNQGTVKSTVSSLESNVSNLKSKMLQNQVSANLVKEYGDFLIHAVLGKAKVKQVEVENSVISSVNGSLDGYFAKSNEYSDKMESLKRNTDKIGGHLGNIETFADELDTVSGEIVDFTKKQTEKISLHHDSLVHKGKEFDEDARNVIEKNREVSLGVMKGKTSEILMAARSLGVMLSDKQDQVETYKERLKDTGETFKHHEGVLVTQHDKHLDDVKGGKKELIEEKDKLFSEKQNAIKKLEVKNEQLERDLKQSQQETNKQSLEIAKLSGESQLIDGTLKAMLMMMGVNMGELNDCKGPMLAQKCFSKYIEIKSQK